MTRSKGTSRNLRAKGSRNVLPRSQESSPFPVGPLASSLEEYGGLYRFLILQTRLWVLLTATELETVGALSSPALMSPAAVREPAGVHCDPLAQESSSREVLESMKFVNEC